MQHDTAFHQVYTTFAEVTKLTISGDLNNHNLEILTGVSLKYMINDPILIAFICMVASLAIQMVNNKLISGRYIIDTLIKIQHTFAFSKVHLDTSS